jgi:hypothetical protein
MRSSAGRTPASVGGTICVAIRYRLAASPTVSGSQRVPSRVRNQPLKSIDHSSFGAVAPVTISPCGHGRRRRGVGAISPARFKMSPIVEVAGQPPPGCSARSLARIFFGPNCGNRWRSATIAAISSAGVVCGRRAGARERSSNQRASPLSRRRRQT